MVMKDTNICQKIKHKNKFIYFILDQQSSQDYKNVYAWSASVPKYKKI